MAFLLNSVLSKHLRSILKTTPLISTNNALQKFGSIPNLTTSEFRVCNSSKFGYQKRQIQSGAKEEEEENKGVPFSELRELLNNHPQVGDAIDCFMRNAMRLHFNNFINGFANSSSKPSSLIPNNLTLLQLVLIDENRFIQEHRFKVDRINPNAPDVAERSRKLFRGFTLKHMFRELILIWFSNLPLIFLMFRDPNAPCLLHDTGRWVFSRSMVFNDYNNLINETPKFTTHDPVGGLQDLPFYIPNGTPDIEVMKNLPSLVFEACKGFKPKPFGMPFIRCTEAFLFIAGDYALDVGGLNSRLAVQNLLHELNSGEIQAKIHGFDVEYASARVNPEMFSVIKDMHLTH